MHRENSGSFASVNSFDKEVEDHRLDKFKHPDLYSSFQDDRLNQSNMMEMPEVIAPD